jgi:Ca2+-binding RTX toxin-like protein
LRPDTLTLFGGFAREGGAIINQLGGTLTVFNSTFSDNRAQQSGGAIRNLGVASGEPRPRDGDADGDARCDIGAFELNPLICRGRAVNISVSNNTIFGGPDSGTPYTGTLRGTNGNDVIVGTDTNDSINRRRGNDIICGGAGRDTLRGAQAATNYSGRAVETGLSEVLAGISATEARVETRRAVANGSRASRNAPPTAWIRGRTSEVGLTKIA